MVKKNKLMLMGATMVVSMVGVFADEINTEKLDEGYTMVNSFLSRLGTYAIGILGAIAFFGLLAQIGKFFMAKSNDNAQALKDAQQGMKNWGIGFVLLLFAMAVKGFLFGL